MALIDLFPNRNATAGSDAAVTALDARVITLEDNVRTHLRVRRTADTMADNEHPHITAIVDSASGTHYLDFDHLDGDIDEWPLSTSRDFWRLLHLGETIDWIPEISHHMRVGHCVRLADGSRWKLTRELQGVEMQANPSDPSVANAWVPA